MTSVRTGRLSPAAWVGVSLVLIVLLLAPVIFSDFFYGVLLTRALWLGLVAMSVIFLASYGGMVSLAQVGLFGVAGFTMANLVAADGGIPAAIDPWLAVIAGLGAAVVVGLIFGAIAARSEGIYFLMITLAFGVMVFYFFGQVTQLSGHGGVNNIEVPSIIGDRVTDPAPLYYICLGVSAIAFLGVRYLARTPFGLSLQGIRDDPTRMRALGYHVTLHRMVAFGFAALIAAAAGILSVWYNRRIGPGSVNLGEVIDVLVIAVIGGLYRLQGAWVGAVAFVLLDNYSRSWTPDIGTVLGPDRFNTLLGLIFLAIVLVSPGGLVGLWERARDWLRAQFGRQAARDGPGGPPRAGPGGEEGDPGPVAAADRPTVP